MEECYALHHDTTLATTLTQQGTCTTSNFQQGEQEACKRCLVTQEGWIPTPKLLRIHLMFGTMAPLQLQQGSSNQHAVYDDPALTHSHTCARTHTQQQCLLLQCRYELWVGSDLHCTSKISEEERRHQSWEGNEERERKESCEGEKWCQERCT